MKNIKLVSIILLILVSVGIFAQERNDSLAKFEPPDGKTIFVMGQDKKTINEYVKKVGPLPSGLAFYTATTDGGGLSNPVDYGAGEGHANYYLKQSQYSQIVVQLAIWMVGEEDAILSGKRDAKIDKIGEWIKNCGHPVFLRIGYECDAKWNAHEPDAFIKCYRKIVDRYREMGIDNVAYVWHSAAASTYNNYDFKLWWPGDDYVDWVGVSVFHQFFMYNNTPDLEKISTIFDLERVCEFAKEKGKPIGIMESTPYSGITKDNDKKIWNEWFRFLFIYIEKYDMKMLSYINANWDQQEMWKNGGWGDCRVQTNPIIKEKWLEQINKDRYIKGTDNVFELIGFTPKN